MEDLKRLDFLVFLEEEDIEILNAICILANDPLTSNRLNDLSEDSIFNRAVMNCISHKAITDSLKRYRDYLELEIEERKKEVAS